jgi:hypothetical protein
MNKFYLTIFLSIFSIGCHSVDVSKLRLDQQQVESCVYISVQDDRPYILSGEKDPNFVGIVRGGYGNPFDFTSSSGNSLAKDLGLAIQRSLSGSKGVAKYIDGKLISLSNSENCKTVVLKFTEWKIDAMVNAWFMHNAEITVYSAKGIVLAKKSLSDKKSIKGSFWDPLGAAKDNFLAESRKITSELLSDPQVSNSLLKP